MTAWNRIERGTGRALVLLHGGGSSARCWLPVLDRLGAERRAIALDFPGFGRTPAVRDAVFSMDWAMEQLAAELRRLGIVEPVDLAGNSMGGWFGLEAAKRGMARSVVAIGPAGLWAKGMPAWTQAQFGLGAGLAWTARTPLRRSLGSPAVRRRLLSVPVGHPERLTEQEATWLAQDLSRSLPTLTRALRVARRTRFEGGHAIDVPVTIAVGTLDRMVRPADSQFRDQLPAHARWIELPDVGHMPMWEAPDLIADTILEGTAEAAPRQEMA